MTVVLRDQVSPWDAASSTYAGSPRKRSLMGGQIVRAYLIAVEGSREAGMPALADVSPARLRCYLRMNIRKLMIAVLLLGGVIGLIGRAARNERESLAEMHARAVGSGANQERGTKRTALDPIRSSCAG